MNNRIGNMKRSLREALMVVGSICLCLLAFSCNHKAQSDVSPSYQELMVGSWVTNADVLGKSSVTEVFNVDGTWQRGDSSDSIQTIGRWTLEGKDTIRINETGIRVGATYDSLDIVKVYVIVVLDNERLVFKDGDNQMELKRKMN